MVAEKPLIVIVGPTASGKTGLAIKIAKQFDGEVISADSRAIYRGMNIGTAKPSKEEQDGIKHWGIDLVYPDERFTAADFQSYANEKINDIRSRGKIPILAGGSGLYIDSVIYSYSFNTDHDQKQRSELNSMDVNELQQHCRELGINLPNNYQNKRYLVRAIERAGRIDDDRHDISENTIIVGVDAPKDDLMTRISERAEQMFCKELFEETRELVGKYPFGLEAMKSNIYPIAWRLINSEISRDEAIKLFVIDDWHLAKKQKTWFKRNPHIEWLSLAQAEEYIEKKLFSLNK